MQNKSMVLLDISKKIFNSEVMLVLLGCLPLYKSSSFKSLNIYNDIFPQLEEHVFIKLNDEEIKFIKDGFRFTGNSKRVLSLFDTILKRDSKYNINREDKLHLIMLHSLMFLLNYNTDVENYDYANKSIFSEDSVLTKENYNFFKSLLQNIENRLTILNRIKQKIEQKTTAFGNIRTIYNTIIQKHKSVITILKGRDDNSNKSIPNIVEQHLRFKLNDTGKNRINDSLNEPLILTYNETPMVIPKMKNGKRNQHVSTTSFKFYGFDKIMNEERTNNEVSDDLITFLKESSDKTQPLCLVGYGQSGSGKTSLLVYLNYTCGEEETKEDGILIKILQRLKPEKVKLEIIEILQKKVSQENDKISGSFSTKTGKFIQGKPKNRKLLTRTNRDGGNMRLIQVDEIKHKYHIEEGLKNEYKSTGENKYETEFVQVIDKEKNIIWTHTEQKNVYTMKNYILSGFECRDIEPTGNNKKSSRSHVVCSLKLYDCVDEDGTKYNKHVFICDLAGVENEFNCKPDSEDIQRLILKARNNKNYSLKSKKENWKDLSTIHRKTNSIRYLDSTIAMAQNTGDNVVCYPDGTNVHNLSEIQEKVLNIVNNLLKKLQNKYKKKKQQYQNEKSFNTLKNRSIGQINEKLKEFDSYVINEKKIRTLVKSINKNQMMNDKVISIVTNKILNTCIKEYPCENKFNESLINICTMRKKEGYVINNELKKMTNDMKIISKNSIKKSLEKVTQGLPLLFGDVYDEYEDSGSMVYEPLLSWYDIDFRKRIEVNKQLGLIFNAMAYLRGETEESRNKIVTNYDLQLKELSDFKFTIVTVLNKTYHMNFCRKQQIDKYGNPIFVNNPPSPPYINISQLTLLVKQYRDSELYSDKTRLHSLCVLLCQHFHKLLFSLLFHSLYYSIAKKTISKLQESQMFEFKSAKENQHTMYDNMEIILNEIKIILDMITKNNAATMIGTIETTEMLNRVSEKITISKDLEFDQWVKNEKGYETEFKSLPGYAKQSKTYREFIKMVNETMKSNTDTFMRTQYFKKIKKKGPIRKKKSKKSSSSIKRKKNRK